MFPGITPTAVNESTSLGEIWHGKKKKTQNIYKNSIITYSLQFKLLVKIFTDENFQQSQYWKGKKLESCFRGKAQYFRQIHMVAVDMTTCPCPVAFWSCWIKCWIIPFNIHEICLRKESKSLLLWCTGITTHGALLNSALSHHLALSSCSRVYLACLLNTQKMLNFLAFSFDLY